ncbi:MAG: CoA transferase [Alphaproteobacteria bacterium]|jgi:crotonobetainyl-CoA:carnitine CoA-transferase CaiB-like acyl-CoA transferase|nr:CoA transferase [Alphaproteobacteria bacterium]
MAGALDGIKVLDLARYVAGPYCAQMLGDFGADVVKIEKPDTGDIMRGPGAATGDDKLYMLMFNRNKRSLTLDLRHPGGREILASLIREADVLVENFRPGTMEAMDFGWEQVSALNPRLVMARISGFGQDGPWAARPAFDAIAQAEGGLMHLTGSADGEATMFGAIVIDYSTGTNAALGVMAALHARERTGRGQVVDVPLLDTAMSFLMTAVAEHHRDGTVMGRQGNRDRYGAPTNSYRTRDGERLHLMAANQKHFEALLEIMGETQVLGDPRFATPAQRLEDADLVDETVAGWFLRHDRDWLLDRLLAAGVPCARLADVSDLVENPQVEHRGQIIEVGHAKLGPVKMQGNPIRLTDTPVETHRAVPTLGQHSDEILGEWLNLDPDAIAALRQDKVI